MTGKVPSMAEINGLQLVDIEEDCYLTDLENNLIALNLNFQYIFSLQKSRWAATKNQMISVPVTPNTVLNTVEQLPRLPKDAGLIAVKLKRKKTYMNCHKKELVNPRKILRALYLLKKYGHPHYQFFTTDYESYEARCKSQDSQGHQLLFEDEDSETEMEDDNSQASDEESRGQENDDEFEQQRVMKDQIKKHQFDHNRHTAMTNNYPEAEVDDNGRKIDNEELAFAPAEGNYPTNILDEKDWDIKSWPTLHPDGKFGIHHKRKQRLTDNNIFAKDYLTKI